MDYDLIAKRSVIKVAAPRTQNVAAVSNQYVVEAISNSMYYNKIKTIHI